MSQFIFSRRDARGASPWFKRIVTMSCVFALLTLAVSPAEAQKSSPDSTVFKAEPKDVASIDAIIKATYDVISGMPGEQRNWRRFRSLFIEGARLIPASPGQNGKFGVRVLDVDSFIQLAEPFYLDKGFFEQEIAQRREQFGHIAHVFSTYESRNHPNDPEPFARGINSFQLAYDGERWWIVTIFWEGEGPNNPIPEKYLPLKK